MCRELIRGQTQAVCTSGSSTGGSRSVSVSQTNSAFFRLALSSHPLRICHLGKYYPPATGGMESHVRLLARGQAELGADVRVVCVNHRSAAGRDVTWHVVHRTDTVEERDGPVRVTRVGRRASLARFDVCPSFPRLLRKLAHEGVDLFHLHAPNPTTVLALNLYGRHVPLFITHQSDVIRQKLLGLAFRRFELPVYRRAKALFQTSPEYAFGSPLLRRFSDRTRTLPLGIDIDAYLNPSPESLRIAGEWKGRFGEPLWLCVGRLVYYKGLENAIRAAARARAVGGNRHGAAGAGLKESRSRSRRGGSCELARQRRRRRIGRRLLRGDGPVVSQQRSQRSLWAGSSRGNGVRLSGDQYPGAAQRRVVGLPARTRGAHRADG